MDTRLSPVSSPFALLGHFGISPLGAGEVLLVLVLVLWALYTLVAIYHWLRYSHAALIAIPAIIGYLVVSAIFISFALSGAAAI
jgi:hypothetical protein